MDKSAKPLPGVPQTNHFDSSIVKAMKDTEDFIKAYHDFKKTVDFTKGGLLPELDNLVWSMLMGIPHVPADEDPSEEASLAAIDQRVTILKAVFVEANRDQEDEFLDQGLIRYDQAGKMAKILLHSSDSVPGTGAMNPIVAKST